MFEMARSNTCPCLGAVVILAASTLACGVRTPLADSLSEATLSKDAGEVPPPPSGDAAPDAAAAVPDATTDASGLADVALPSMDLGNILLTSGSYADGGVQTLAAEAQFFPSVAVTGCVVAEVAGCTVETCQLAGPGLGTVVSAGAISVSGGSYPLVMEQVNGGQYGAVFDDGGSTALWRGGEQLTVQAAGGDVPAFAQDVVTPTEVMILTPMPPLLSRAAPFAFSWLGASAGLLTVDASETVGATSFYAECQFDVAAGTGTVPRETLQQLPRGAVLLTVSTVNRSAVGAGPWLIKTFVQTNASDPSGLEYTRTVELE